jgi:hypothetical protein
MIHPWEKCVTEPLPQHSVSFTEMNFLLFNSPRGQCTFISPGPVKTLDWHGVVNLPESSGMRFSGTDWCLYLSRRRVERR